MKRPTARQRRLIQSLAIVGNVIPILLLLSPGHGSLAFLAGAMLALVAPIVVTMAPPHRFVTQFFSYAGIIGLTLLQWDNGGVGSTYALLLTMPMIWFGLFGSARELKAVIALVVACCFAPMLIFPAHYPQTPTIAAALVVILASVNLSIAGLIRETKRLTAKLTEAATRDQLTGLLNRRGWEEVTERELTMGRDRTPHSVVLIDLDSLKQINDTDGHGEGDQVLKDTGSRLAEFFQGEAAVSRLGGDEFALLLVGQSSDQVHARLEALRLATPVNGAFSAGIAMAAPDESLRDMLRRADLALYEAKTTGRGHARLADAPVSLDDV